MGCGSSKSAGPSSDLAARPATSTALALAPQNGLDISGIKLNLAGRIDPLARTILTWSGFDREIPGAIDIYLSEFQHSVNILKAWFSSIQDAQTSLRGRRIIDLGCGRAFMTIVLAYMVADNTSTGGGAGKFIGVDDPARSELPASAKIYERLTRSKNVSKHVEFKKLPPVDFLADGPVPADYVCIVHLRIDLGIDLDLFTFMQKLRFWCNAQSPTGGSQQMSVSGSGAKFLMARWSLEASETAAQAHVKAVVAQCNSKAFASRRRFIVSYAEADDYMDAAGWREEKRETIRCPELNAAVKDVQLTRNLMQDRREDVRSIGGEMEALLTEHGTVKCMDVSTTVFSNAVTTIGVY